MPESTADIAITVNGASKDIPEGLTLDGLLVHLGRDPNMPGVAVARNDTVVRRAEWPTTHLDAGDRVEIITASQGG